MHHIEFDDAIYIHIFIIRYIYFEYVDGMCMYFQYIYIIQYIIYLYTVFTRSRPMECCVGTLAESNKMLPNRLIFIALSEWAATVLDVHRRNPAPPGMYKTLYITG